MKNVFNKNVKHTKTCLLFVTTTHALLLHTMSSTNKLTV